MSNVIKKICPNCNCGFSYYDKRRKFCSRLCSNRYHKMFGKDNPKYKLRKWRISNGYEVMWKGHKRIYKHHILMEKHIGRKLKKGEVIHHINNKRSDNRIENLMLFPNNKAHLSYHNKLRIK